MHIPSWLPNAISVVRIALVPLWIAVALEARQLALAGAPPSAVGPVVVFFAIGVSDLVDGFLARRFGLASRAGAVLDAIADKIAQIASVTFLALAGTPAFTPLPIWLLLALAARDVALGIGWLLVRRRRGTVHAEHRWHGKASSALLFVLILVALAGAPATVVAVGSGAVLLLVIPSTTAYLVEGWRQLTASGPSAEPRG